jgi:hypothetical protein
MMTQDHWQLLQEKFFDHLDYSMMYIQNNIIFQKTIYAIQDHL